MWHDEIVPRKPRKPAAETFDPHTYFKADLRKFHELKLSRRAVVYSQGAAAVHVFYIDRGGVKLSVTATTGKEAIVAMLGPGDFFGEGCLAGQPVRMATATAIVPTAVYRIPKAEMMRRLHGKEQFSDYFIHHMLARNIRVEEDLVDQLFNSSEKRLARTLLLLARYGKDDTPAGALPRLSQESLAEMTGSTRSRVNYFMNKFRRLGLIEYKDRIKINSSLLSIVLHD